MIENSLLLYPSLFLKVPEELLRYDKPWSVDLGYLGDLVCPWDSKLALRFYDVMHWRQLDSEGQPRTRCGKLFCAIRDISRPSQNALLDEIKV